ncbi:MAG: hypothetical protein NZM35_05665 [Chitinophagales bacterium]|nr:hypothetical protein [Chitinophagales bacterium]MDW8419086.1 hypothetical protein [Chitinophagales bacterium]
MTRFAILLLLFFSLAASAQDDELPPPTSQPRAPQGQRRPDDDFQGFTTRKKVDLSKFIIEPNFNLSIGQGRVDVGLSPYVGYRIWEPPKRRNTGIGLYAGGGVTYFYTGFRNIEFTDPSGRVYFANANWHTFGGGAFLQYNVWRGLFTRARFEVLHRRLDDFFSGNVTVQLNPQNNTYKVIIPRVNKTIPALLVGAGYNLLMSRNFFFPVLVSYNVLHPFTSPSQRNYSIYPRGLVVQLGFINIF